MESAAGFQVNDGRLDGEVARRPCTYVHLNRQARDFAMQMHTHDFKKV